MACNVVFAIGIASAQLPCLAAHSSSSARTGRGNLGPRSNPPQAGSKRDLSAAIARVTGPGSGWPAARWLASDGPAVRAWVGRSGAATTPAEAWLRDTTAAVRAAACSSMTGRQCRQAFPTVASSSLRTGRVRKVAAKNGR
jgi:hypothetical protein